VAFLVLATCARYVYIAHPLSMDEYAPWMQANAFARGELKVHYPRELLDAIVPRQFQGVFLAVDHARGDAASTYWPGLALSLTPFVWLGAEWCANPAYGALTLALLYGLARDATGQREAGGWAVLAALACPQFTVNAISFYAMPGELALNLLFLWLLLKPAPLAAFAAGLAGGLALAMHNPLPHAIMALPCLIWLASAKERWVRLGAVLVGYLPLVLLLGAGWQAVLGSMSGPAPATSTSVSFMGRIIATFGSFLRIPTDDMLIGRWYATWKTWIWACPGLLLIAFLPRRRAPAERLLLAALVVTFVFDLFVRFDQGHGWGYRYIHPVWGLLPLAAGTWMATADNASRRWGATIVAAGLIATPVFMWQTHETIADALSYRIAPTNEGDWVVFVRQDTGRYRGDLVQNPPGQDSLLYLVSQGEEKDHSLMRRWFPDAELRKSDRTGSAWRLPAGKLKPRLEAMSR
jgi:hypothetical protein